MANRPSDVWWPATRVARLLMTNNRAVPRIAKAAGVRTQVLPGLPPRYHAGDVKALAETVVRGPETAAEGVALSEMLRESEGKG